MARKRPPHLPLGYALSEEKLRAMTESQLDHTLNTAFNVLEGYEDTAKVAKRFCDRLAYDIDAVQAREAVQQILAEKKRRIDERAEKAEKAGG